MSYLGFHGVFLLPAILVLACAVLRQRPAVDRRAWSALAGIALVAVAYATPWDIRMVRDGVWSYERNRVVGTLAGVPLEEYLFFLLQPLLTGLWLYRLFSRDRGLSSAAPGLGGRAIGTLFWLAVALTGAALLQWGATHDRGQFHYLGMILSWAGPILALQWAYGGDLIWAQRRRWLLATLLPTAYLCAADRLAIHLGIWRISEQHTVGIALFGLPIEEGVFFLATNLMVVQGLIGFFKLVARHEAARSVPVARPGLPCMPRHRRR